MKLARHSLTIRIYLVSLAQLLAIAGAVLLVGFLSFQPNAHGGMQREARFAMHSASDHLDDPAGLERELRRVRDVLNGKLSIYDAEGRLLASSLKPALAPLAPELVAYLRKQDFYDSGRPPPLLAVPIRRAGAFKGYVVYRPGRPPPPPRRMLLGLAIALVAAAIASILLARSFARPLQALASAARSLGTGDLNARARLTRRDEFGELSNAFDEMAERVARLVRAQQELLANVSHELRTPLARIRVALDLAAEGDAATAREALSEITEDLAELERLVTDVLQTARLDLAAGRAGHGMPSLRGDPVELDALLHKSAARFRAAHPERLLVVECPAHLPGLRGDAVLLRRALDNLLENARAYSEAPVKLSAARQADSVQIVVEDQGIGIAEADLAQVATPFFRSDRSRARRSGGLGLGLSMARRIVEQHGGSLVVESELGRGTRVRLSFADSVLAQVEAGGSAREPNETQRPISLRASSPKSSTDGTPSSD